MKPNGRFSRQPPTESNGSSSTWDAVAELDIPGVRSLIELLRRARANKVELVLAIDRPEVRATLVSMALDRIFTITTPEAV